MNFQQPTLILDTARCRRNIQRMAERAKQFSCTFRPHFKTHQSHTISRWFREAGVTGITVSSVSMAKYFAEDGWDDITIAFPFFRNQLPGLRQLEKNVKLRLFINSTEDLEFLNQKLSHPFDFMIEIDPDYGRSGILYSKTEKIEELIELDKKFDRSNFHGFYIHDGRTYLARNKTEIKEKIDPTINILLDLEKQFPQAVLSLGDTPSASTSDRWSELDEMTPGNFVFYDYMQVQIGSCSLDDVAVFAVLPVGQTFPESNRTILHGGACHLSREFIQTKEKANFGQVIHYSPDSDISVEEGLFITAMSQEHGTLNGLPPNHNDHIWVCPVHSCLTANLYDHYFTTDGEIISKRVLS